MALSGCYALLKYILILVNLIFWLVGLAVVVISVWMLTDETFILSIAQDEMNYYTGIYMLLAAGIILFVVGFLGCCGSYRESQCMLVSFFCFLLIIVVAEIAAGAWAYVNSDKLELYVRESVKYSVEKEYGNVNTRTITFDEIQSQLKCCGANGPRDWAGSDYNRKDKNPLEVMITSVAQIYKIPPSCCSSSISTEVCDTFRKVGFTAHITEKIYSEGCIDKLLSLLRQYMDITVGVGVVILIIEILGLIFSLIICCVVRSEDRYKA